MTHAFCAPLSRSELAADFGLQPPAGGDIVAGGGAGCGQIVLVIIVIAFILFLLIAMASCGSCAGGGGGYGTSGGFGSPGCGGK